MFSWRIYYGDGSTYDGPVEDAPARNVQIIAQADPDHGWIALSGTDYYIWRGDRWFGVNADALYDYLIDPGWKKVLFGRMLSSAEYNAVWQRLAADTDLPQKTGSPQGERSP